MAKKGWKRPPMTKERFKNSFLNVVGNPFNVIVLITLLMLFVFIVIPLITMVLNTFTVTRGSADMARRVDPGVNPGDYSIWAWKFLFGANNFVSSGSMGLRGTQIYTNLLEPLFHSLTVGFFVTIISVPLGALMAWLMVRTDLPAKGLLSALILIPYMIPSWCKALSWLTVFRTPKYGGYYGLLTGLGVPVPEWLAYGPIAIILVMVLHYYAFSYIMVSGALRSINSELEEMGEIQGANKLQILKSITLPLVLPSILSATIMTISKSIGTYGVAARLGNTIQYYVLATKMKYFLESQQTAAVGYIFSMLMIALAAGTILINQKLIGTRKSYATIGGKGTRSNLIPLGGAKWPMLIFLTIFIIVAMFMPLFFLVMESFQIIPGKGYRPDNLTLYAWIGALENAPNEQFNQPGLFQNPEFFRSLWNTVKLSVIGSLVTAVFGQFFGPRQRQVVRQCGGAADLHPVPDAGRCVCGDLLFAREQLCADPRRIVHARADRFDRQALPVRQPVRFVEHDADFGGARGSGDDQRRGLLEKNFEHRDPACQGRIPFGLFALLHQHRKGAGPDRDSDDESGQLHAVVPLLQLFEGSHAAGGGRNLYHHHRVHPDHQPHCG